LDEKNNWVETTEPTYPTPKEVNEWAKYGFGHDASNQYIAVEARAKHLGVYGECKYCEGEGVLWYSDDFKKLHDEFVSFNPPEGEGFQLWETTSEGSPSSPVFKTLDELCTWCEVYATTFAHFKATKDKWKQMLDADFVVHQEGNHIFI
jgi:hypothetical protein